MDQPEALESDRTTARPDPDGGSAAAADRFPLRLVTWNLNHWRQSSLPVDTRRAAWAYLADELAAGAALLQEAVPPDHLTADRVAYGELAGHRHWGSAVVALDPGLTVSPIRSVRMPRSRRRYLLANTHPGSVAVAELAIPGIEPITLVSIYGVMDGSAVSTMLRIVADLVPLFDSPQGARVILAGDLNVSRSTADARCLARAEAVIGAIGALGLVEAKGLVPDAGRAAGPCPCGGEGCDHIATWRDAELDHVFVSPALADQVVGLSADRRPVELGLSDHVPLVLDLALSAERTPQAWDEEAFAVEVGRRHGAASRVVVERLVAWADERERLMGEADGVRVRGLTRFPTNGVTTEPELWFPLDFDLAPRGTQATFSIRARGDVVVQFGRMHHPPFDTPDGREPLRRLLDDIPGVDIPTRELDGWPSFPLCVLEDPANLVRFVAVIDRVVTESRPIPA